jgi:hypothetical protein
MEPSPCLLHHSPLLPRLPASPHRPPFFLSSKTSHLTRTLRLRLPAATRHTPGAGEEEESDDGFIQIARRYESPFARLALSGAARREQAVAAAAAADGGAAADAHLAAGSDAMVMQAFLPAADDDRSVASTRLVCNFKLYSPIIRHATFYSKRTMHCCRFCKPVKSRTRPAG